MATNPIACVPFDRHFSDKPIALSAAHSLLASLRDFSPDCRTQSAAHQLQRRTPKAPKRAPLERNQNVAKAQPEVALAAQFGLGEGSLRSGRRQSGSFGLGAELRRLQWCSSLAANGDNNSCYKRRR